MNKSNNSLIKLTATFALFCAAGSSNAADIQAIGPVEKVSGPDSTFVVLGHTFHLPTTLRASSLTSFGVSEKVTGLRVGAYVAVSGKQLADGTLIARSIKPLNEEYVPGASEVFIQGTVDQYSPATGVAQIGSVQIQVSQALAGSAASIRIGDLIELTGIQALAGGPVWAQGIAIQGTGAQSNAIQGTGVQSVAIQGTGAQSIAIQGTGAQSIAIQGTGSQSIAIQGTGAQSIAIQGTGAQSIAIQGTGAQLIAIQGTGARPIAIQGTGSQALAIQGTGY